MRILIEIYFGLNLISVGWYLNSVIGWKPKDSMSWIVFLSLLHALFYVPYFICTFLYVVFLFMLKPVWKFLDRHTMIPFYIGFYFGTYKNMNVEALIYLNKTIETDSVKADTKTYNKWKKAISMVNRQNNYTPAN